MQKGNTRAPNNPVEQRPIFVQEIKPLASIRDCLNTIVPGKHAGAAGSQGRRGSIAGAPQSEDAVGFSFRVRKSDLGFYRSLSVASPASASTVAMIQKRITTVGSAQPFCSKWWCNGAIRKTRLPVSLKEAT